MYWNKEDINGVRSNYRLIETWDVLKSIKGRFFGDKTLINRNMRCIEIQPSQHLCCPPERLIETWDVLKSLGGRGDGVEGTINRNMRCIEIPF